MLRCMAAIGLGTTLDFMVVPPQAILDMCSTRGAAGLWSGIADALFAHLKWFPLTVLAMLALVAAQHIHGWRAEPTSRAVATLRATCRTALDFSAMLATMAVSMMALRSLALALGLPWTANALVSTMLLSMLAFLLLRGWCAVTMAALQRRHPISILVTFLRR